MSTTEVSQTYSQLGSSLIERLYGDDYLSIGGKTSTDLLVAQAGVTSYTRVLDVGSGLGGPALHLAETHGCSVTGLDIVETNVCEANRRANARSLGHLVTFQLGDATAMPFEMAQFDLVMGQDAWCHVPDKDTLIEECARVVIPGGTLAFTDWLQVGEMAADERGIILAAITAPNLATSKGYRDLLQKHGFTISRQDDISPIFVDQYRDIIAKLKAMKAEISENISPKVFGVLLDKNTTILDAFEQSKMGGGRLIATKS
jgi:ubiquinone/menaquinone biosynthesis C-methylase UbiE